MLQLTMITVDICRTALEQSNSVASCKPAFPKLF
jgi:hypothetical protein